MSGLGMNGFNGYPVSTPMYPMIQPTGMQSPYFDPLFAKLDQEWNTTLALTGNLPIGYTGMNPGGYHKTTPSQPHDSGPNLLTIGGIATAAFAALACIATKGKGAKILSGAKGLNPAKWFSPEFISNLNPKNWLKPVTEGGNSAIKQGFLGLIDIGKGLLNSIKNMFNFGTQSTTPEKAVFNQLTAHNIPAGEISNLFR